MIKQSLLFASVAAIVLAGCRSEPASAQVRAFPGAEGAGAYSLGGRGGRVIHVTNLNDGGPGSLRAAVEASGPRTVVFDVGGTIALSKPLSIRNGRITVAGQTAPGGGITLRNYTFGIAADDVVVRFIRARMGDTSRSVGDAIWITDGHRIILDHISASWGTDEVLSASSTYMRPRSDLHDLTVQWSIISESLCNSVNPDGRHCYGSLLTGGMGARMSFHHNLWAHHAGRLPRLGNAVPPGKDKAGALFDFRSNVFYNWGGHQAGYSGGPGRVRFNFVDNSYWSGPATANLNFFTQKGHAASQGWFAGNAMNGVVPADQWSMVMGAEARGNRLGGPIDVAPVARDRAASAYQRVLASAGASLVRDSVDERTIADVRSRGGRLIDSQRDVGGWPQLARGTPWRDSDGDGMPDDWERSHRLNPGEGRDGNMDANRDGYTNLEEWLNALASRAMG
jgi:hypothetical protein